MDFHARHNSPRRNRRLKPIPPGMTTLVVRNVPSEMTCEDALNVWPAKGMYNYIYLPRHSFNNNAGYAFVNFLTHESAVCFNTWWHGRFIPGWWSPKTLNLTIARLQGLEQNLAFLGLKKLEEMAVLGSLPVTFVNDSRADALTLYRSLCLPSNSFVHAQGELQYSDETDQCACGSLCIVPSTHDLQTGLPVHQVFRQPESWEVPLPLFCYRFMTKSLSRLSC